MFTKTNARQFVLLVQGLRKPAIGEVFEIEVPPYRERIEVECVELRGYHALCERTEEGQKPEDGVRSRVISERKVRPEDLPHGERVYAHQTTEEILAIVAAERDYDDHLDSFDRYEDWEDSSYVREAREHEREEQHWSERDPEFA